IRKFQQLEICIRDHDVFRLAADPSTHVDITISRPRTIRVYVLANMCVLLFTAAAAATSDIKRDRYQVAFFNEFNITADFNDFTCNFMAKDKPFRSGRPATHHVLVTTANIRSHNFYYHSMFAFAPYIQRIYPGTVSDD